MNPFLLERVVISGFKLRHQEGSFLNHDSSPLLENQAPSWYLSVGTLNFLSLQKTQTK